MRSSLTAMRLMKNPPVHIISTLTESKFLSVPSFRKVLSVCVLRSHSYEGFIRKRYKRGLKSGSEIDASIELVTDWVTSPCAPLDELQTPNRYVFHSRGFSLFQQTPHTCQPVAPAFWLSWTGSHSLQEMVI